VTYDVACGKNQDGKFKLLKPESNDLDVAFDLVEGKNLVGLSPADTVRANEQLSSELEIASRRRKPRAGSRADDSEQ
jgi:hypothetical protein